MLESKNISSILVTNEEGRMTTIFQRSDIFKLDIMDINLFEQPLCSIPALVGDSHSFLSFFYDLSLFERIDGLWIESKSSAHAML